ncbi:non-ribosomal peptide synthetase [Paracraurococcus lichenis]|uniref:Non-ribosomal peptide synthetase n=1 Tax=Paracraurococcus lichenis TaxID=3064888 RepID=A0ABT9E8Z4_9PROT|nr:non-ribosomal peptide synthetase [Paracraurococcus sp. LOR1-02]MDO9712574.1 non-ribosomal peptide synthetase [Paracraurococcus sp. LOR1-02]
MSDHDPAAPQCVAAAFTAAAGTYADRTAILCGDDAVTYAALDRLSASVAARLQDAGLRRGAIVGIAAPRGIEAIVAMLGVLRAGAAYLPLDLANPASVLRRMTDDCAAAVVVHADGVDATWAEHRLPIRGPDRAPSVGHAAAGPDSLAYVMYTSGSSGRPKGTMIPQRGILRLVLGCDYASLGADEVVLHAAPLGFDASTFEIWGALLNGGKLAILPEPSPSLAAIGAAIQRHGVTTAWLTAGLFHLMVEQQLPALRGLRQLLAGGDVLSPPHVARVLAELPGCRLINGYGPTENTTFTCCYTVPRNRPAPDPVPIGLPIRGTTVHLLDSDLQPVPDGEEGELCAGGLGVALGYVAQPELTAEKFVADPFSRRPDALLYRTGDRVRKLPDGTLAFLGRVDRQVKIAGKRVELDAVEAALRQTELVQDAAAVTAVDRVGQRRIRAFLACPAGASPAQLRAQLKDALPAHMLPSEIIVLPALPLNANGKVDRARLALHPVENAPAAPEAASGTEDILRGIWCGVLGRTNVALDANFFDLGGTSLQLIEAHGLISAAVAGPVAVVDLFEHPTIRALAARIDGGAARPPGAPGAAGREEARRAAIARARRGAVRMTSA